MLTKQEYVGNDPLQLSKINVFFEDSNQEGKYVPRSVNVDLEPGTIDHLRAGPLGRCLLYTSPSPRD